MSNSSGATKEFVQDLLKQYPEKTAKKRAGHLTVKETTTDETGASNCSICAVKSNIKSIPGVMTARGCAYAGSKGVVWGPIRDMVHLSHGPVGCGYYSWSTRRNLAQGTPGVDNFVPFQFTSDYQERDIVYGGAQRLEMIGREIRSLFPLAKGISVQSECPIGLIGDPFRQMHSWDYSGPCHGYEGFPIFARDMDMAINSPTWKLVKDPFAA